MIMCCSGCIRLNMAPTKNSNPKPGLETLLHHHQLRTASFCCRCSSARSHRPAASKCNFCNLQVTALTAEAVRLKRTVTRRAPVTILPRQQHAAPLPPPLHLPSNTASADGAAASPNSTRPFRYAAGSQAATPPTLQVQEAAAAEQDAAWAPQKHGAAQVRLCAHLHAIFHCHCHYNRCHLDAVTIAGTLRPRLHPHHILSRSKVAHAAAAANAARATRDVAAC